MQRPCARAATRGQTRRRGRDAMSAKTGVMICGHGSRDEDAIAEFTAFARAMAERLPEHVVESGFLEFARPVIRDGLDALRAAGVERILAVPGMLFAAGHAKNDIPSVLNAWAAERRGPPVDYARELGIDPKLVRAAGARVEAALAAAGDPVPRADTALVVVGRGASDPDANANVAKVMRLLWEGLGLGWGETAYSGVTFPVVAPALDRVARLGFPRVVVFPWFLFTGVPRQAHLRAYRPRRGPLSGDRISQSELSRRPPARGRDRRRPRWRPAARRQRDELPAVQVSRARARFRG